jgi:hypothetical protein
MGLRVTKEEERLGLDVSQHGEQAYAGLVWYVPSVVTPHHPHDEGGDGGSIRPEEMRYTYEKKKAVPRR